MLIKEFGVDSPCVYDRTGGILVFDYALGTNIGAGGLTSISWECFDIIQAAVSIESSIGEGFAWRFPNTLGFYFSIVLFAFSGCNIGRFMIDVKNEIEIWLILCFRQWV